MDPLARAIRDLSSDRFEDLCFHLLKARHPGMDIKRVQARVGDEGIDVFQGKLEDQPVIWQCKSFPTGVAKSQKNQIRASLRTALKYCAPSRWVLALSIDMDPSAHRWFERLQKSYGGSVEIGLMQSSDIVHQLIYLDTIREHFFPHVGLNVREIREAISKTGELSDDELQRLNEANLHEYIDRFRERDARFNYEISYTLDRATETSGERSRAMFSLTRGKTRIDAYPRDLEALRIDPPRISFTLKSAGVSKWREMQRTGKRQEFGPDEFESVGTNLKIFEHLSQLAQRMLIEPRVPDATIPARLTFGTGDDAVVYPHIAFQITRLGSEELELTSTGGHPFVFHITWTTAGRGGFNIPKRFAGTAVEAVQKLLRGIEAVRRDGVMELYDLEREKRILRGKIGPIPKPSERDLHVAEVIDAAVEVATGYGVQLKVPTRISEADADSLEFLHGILRGRAATGPIDTEMDKPAADLPSFLADVERGKIGLKLQHPGIEKMLFGTTVKTGPVEFRWDGVTLVNAGEVVDKWPGTAPGAPLHVVFSAPEGAQVTRLPSE